VHLLHPIFKLGREEHAGQSPYQVIVSKAQQPEEMIDSTTTKEKIDSVDSTSTKNVNNFEDELDAAHHRDRSLRRRASLKHRFESGQSLSDTHSNTWPYNKVEENEEMQKDRAMNRAEVWGRRQTERRHVVQDRIERGKALSDSTGGHWSNDDRK